MISACALERVSTRPRATSAMSRRSRFRAVPSLFVVIAARGRIGNRIRRDAFDAPQHSACDGGVCGLAAVFQHQIRLITRIEEKADVERAVASIGLEQ